MPQGPNPGTVAGFWNLLSGFLIPIPAMPGWWVWAAWINPVCETRVWAVRRASRAACTLLDGPRSHPCPPCPCPSLPPLKQVMWSIYGLVITQLGSFDNEYITGAAASWGAAALGRARAAARTCRERGASAQLPPASALPSARRPGGHSEEHPAVPQRPLPNGDVHGGWVGGCGGPFHCAWRAHAEGLAAHWPGYAAITGPIVAILIAYVLAFGALAIVALRFINFQRR